MNERNKQVRWNIIVLAIGLLALFGIQLYTFHLIDRQYDHTGLNIGEHNQRLLELESGTGPVEGNMIIYVPVGEEGLACNPYMDPDINGTLYLCEGFRDIEESLGITLE